MNTVPPDNIDRLRAATSLDKNVIVLAGAGTGKTTLLIDRLSLLILCRETPIEKIVALTFTKKAAEEMRERLEIRLRKIVDGSENFGLLEEYDSKNRFQWPRLAAKALEDIPKAQIGTIHSFAAHLLRLYPLQAGVDPKFREDEGPLFEELFEKEWVIWLTAELGESSPRAEAWRELLRVVELSELKDIAFEISSPMVESENSFPPANLEPLIKNWLDELRELVSKHGPQEKTRSFGPALKFLENLFEDALQKKPLPDDLDKILNPLATPVNDWKEAKKRLKILTNGAVSLSCVDDNLISLVTSLLHPFIQKVRKEYSRRGAVSFDGLLVFARNLVRDHTKVRNALKNRFETFLVDEFQDTDPIQGEILFYLTEEPQFKEREWRKITLSPGRLFVVGDPKQSIYRFRGADVAAFESFQDHMIRQGAVKGTLSANFRSNPPILGFVNHVFPFVMQESRFVQPGYTPLQAERALSEVPKKSQYDKVELIGIEKHDEVEKISAEEGREAEAEAIAEWIDRRKGEFRFSEMALLFRSSNVFHAYIEALRRRNIPYLVEGEKSFYLTSEVMDFFNLVSAAADPNDRLALVGVLRSPVGGLTDLEILELKQKNGLNYLKAPKIHKDKIGSLYEFLGDIYGRSSSTPVETLVHELLRRSWLAELHAQASYGEQAIANLHKIVSLARKWTEAEPLTLKSFVRRLRRYREDEREEGESPLADVTYEAVKIMTIHKAKGLEFPVVFVPNMSAEVNKSNQKRVVIRDWRTGSIGLRLSKAKKTNSAMVLLEEEARLKEEAEEVRVFYVATTRAKDKLICLKSGAKDKGEFMSYLKEAGLFPSGDGLKTSDQDGSVLYFKPIQWKEASKRKGPLNKDALSKSWDPVRLGKIISERRQFYQEISGKPLILSPSVLLKEDEKYFVRDEEPSSLISNRILVGLLCHKVLEGWNFDLTSENAKRELEKRLLKASHCYELLPSEPLTESIINESTEILQGFISSPEYARLRSVKILGREIPFLYPLNSSNRDSSRLMRGVIDLLYEERGKLVVADYKTIRFDSKSINDTAHRYGSQGRVYQEAVRRALGKPVEFELLFLRKGTAIRI